MYKLSDTRFETDKHSPMGWQSHPGGNCLHMAESGTGSLSLIAYAIKECHSTTAHVVPV